MLTLHRQATPIEYFTTWAVKSSGTLVTQDHHAYRGAQAATGACGRYHLMPVNQAILTDEVICADMQV